MLTGTFFTLDISYLVIQIMINLTLLLIVITPVNRRLTVNVTRSSTNTERLWNSLLNVCGLLEILNYFATKSI